jgi:hypothetical protein
MIKTVRISWAKAQCWRDSRPYAYAGPVYYNIFGCIGTRFLNTSCVMLDGSIRMGGFSNCFYEENHW